MAVRLYVPWFICPAPFRLPINCSSAVSNEAAHLPVECIATCLQATRAYLHKEEAVEAALREAGWQVTKREMTSTRFYYSRLLQAVPAS